jgi:hypothetical protein
MNNIPTKGDFIGIYQCGASKLGDDMTVFTHFTFHKKTRNGISSYIVIGITADKELKHFNAHHFLTRKNVIRELNTDVNYWECVRELVGKDVLTPGECAGIVFDVIDRIKVDSFVADAATQEEKLIARHHETMPRDVKDLKSKPGQKTADDLIHERVANEEKSASGLTRAKLIRIYKNGTSVRGRIGDMVKLVFHNESATVVAIGATNDGMFVHERGIGMWVHRCIIQAEKLNRGHVGWFHLLNVLCEQEDLLTRERCLELALSLVDMETPKPAKKSAEEKKVSGAKIYGNYTLHLAKQHEEGKSLDTRRNVVEESDSDFDVPPLEESIPEDLPDLIDGECGMTEEVRVVYDLAEAVRELSLRATKALTSPARRALFNAFMDASDNSPLRSIASCGCDTDKLLSFVYLCKDRSIPF